MLDALAITSTWDELPGRLLDRYDGRADDIVCYSVLDHWKDDADSLERWQDVNRRFGALQALAVARLSITARVGWGPGVGRSALMLGCRADRHRPDVAFCSAAATMGHPHPTRKVWSAMTRNPPHPRDRPGRPRGRTGDLIAVLAHYQTGKRPYFGAPSTVPGLWRLRVGDRGRQRRRSMREPVPRVQARVGDHGAGSQRAHPSLQSDDCCPSGHRRAAGGVGHHRRHAATTTRAGRGHAGATPAAATSVVARHPAHDGRAGLSSAPPAPDRVGSRGGTRGSMVGPGGIEPPTEGL